MRNEFDDELNRDARKNGNRGLDSEPDPSDEDYYLDDDYEAFQEEQRRIQETESSQSMFRGQSSAKNQESGRRRPQAQQGSGQSRSKASAGSLRAGGPQSPERTAPASRSAAQAGKRKKIRRIIIMAVAEVFALALIFSYAYAARLMNSFQRPASFNQEEVQNNGMTDVQKKHMTGFRTMAVFGVDNRDGDVNRGNTDVIMICNINRDTGEIRLVSVYRDTYLNVSEKNTYDKINSAYARGGASQALAALNKNLDLNIGEYVTFNWKSVADGINMLGGVDIDVTKPEFKYINSFITETVKKTGVGSKQLKSAGLQHLDGVQAVAYARLRLMDTDYARTERQRLVIEKTFEKAKKADLGMLNRILLMEVEQVGTNLTFSDFTELLLDLSKFHMGETGGFPTTRGEMSIGKKGDCVVPQTLESNVAELHTFLFGKENYEPSETVKKISAKIAADSGMYKNGTKTDDKEDGKDKETKPPKATKEEKTTEAEITSEEESTQENTSEAEPPKKGPGETKPSRPAESTSGPAGETTSEETAEASTTAAENQTTEAVPPEEPGPTAAPETTASSSPGPGENMGDIPVVSAPDIV